MEGVYDASKETVATHKKIDSKYRLPDIFEPSMNGKHMEPAINSILKSFNDNDLTIKESLYALELCKEMIINLNSVELKRIELDARHEKFYWFIEETLKDTD